MADGLNYLEVDNHPLGAKFNTGCMAAKETDCDYWTIIGSDCFFRPTIWEPISEYLHAGAPYIGVKDLYMWKPDDRLAVYWPGYEGKEKPVGSLRFCDRATMDGMAWRPYIGGRSRALDASMDEAAPKCQLYSGKDHLFTSVKVFNSLSDPYKFKRVEDVPEYLFYELMSQF